MFSHLANIPLFGILKFWIIKHRKLISFLIYFTFTIIPILAYLPSALADCNSLIVQENWKNHFPFDLVYPIGPEFNSGDSCPTINFWGKERPVCSIPQLTKIIKNFVLANIAIRGLFSL